MKRLLASALLVSLAAPALAGPPVLGESAVSAEGPAVPTASTSIGRIDPDLLHPKPKWKLPIPRPECLSCPPFPADQGLQELVIPMAR